MWITATTGTLESRLAAILRILKGIAMGLLCVVLSACPSETYQPHDSLLPLDSLDEVMARGTLRVVSRVNPATFVLDKHGPSGIEYELARAFASHLGVELEVLPAASIGDAYAALGSGAVDIAASGLSERVRSSGKFRYSEPYLEVSQQIVYRSDTPRPETVADLVGKRVMVLAQSSSAEALHSAQQDLPGLRWMEATRVETFELLKELADGNIDYAVLKSNEFLMHQGLFPRIEVAFELAPAEQLSWAIADRRDNDRLHDAMQEFLRRFEDLGELDLLRERFFGYLPEINRNALTAFATRVDSQLPRYEKLMRRIAEEEGIDWRLLAAISYQESHWNPGAVSRTGVKGMMMLTHAAAAEVGVTDRTNLEQSLRGGARYYLKLLEKISPDIAGPDRELFALAAYNMGLSHVEDARRIASVRGADPDSWTDVEQQLPLLTKREWRAHTRHGYARGYEAASFVNRIRQYHRFLVHHDEGSGLFQIAMSGGNAMRQLPDRS
jgi:membrane-bound lytic murein transglycosylase F